DGFTDPDLREVAVDDEGEPAQFVDPGGGGQLGPKRRLVEDDRHRLRAPERAGEEAVGLEPRGELEDVPLFAGAEVVVFEQVPHSSSWAASRMVVSAEVNSLACAAVSTSGGARRTTFGAA